MSKGYSILSPNAGVELSNPAQFLANNKSSESENMELFDGLLRSRLGLAKQIADSVGTPFLRLDTYQDLDGNQYFMGCTTTDIFELDLAASKPMYKTPTFTSGVVQVTNASAIVYGGLLIDDCDDDPVAWTDGSGGDVTPSKETTTVKENSVAVKLAVAAGAGVEILAYHNITSIDLSAYDSVGFWIRSSVNTNSGDLQFLIDNTNNCASPLETIDIPALTADTWQWVNLTLVDPSALTAVVSIGIKQAVDVGAFNLFLDFIVAGDWAGQAAAGDKFRISTVNDGAFASQVWYTVDTVNSDTQITLTAVYAGSTAYQQVYTLRLIYTGSSSDYWDTCEFTDSSLGRIWVATNGVDVVQYWNATGQMKTLGGSPPKCKYLQPYLDHLFLIWCVVAGQNQPQQVQWCAAGNAQSWPATYLEYLVDAPGEITGVGMVGTYMAVMKEKARYLGRYVGGDFLFDFEPRDTGSGCLSRWSIVPWLGGLYYFGNDQALHFWDGVQDQIISNDILPYIRDFDADLQGNIYGIRIDSKKQIRWFVPTADASGFDAVIVLSLLNNSLEIWPYAGTNHLGVPGTFKLSSDLYVDDSTWGDYYVDEQVGYWDAREFLANAPVVFYGGADGYLRLADTATTDDGTAITAFFRSKRLDYEMPHRKKRLHRLQAWFAAETDSDVTYRIRINDESSFRSVGTFDLTGSSQDVVKPALVVDKTSDVFEHEFRSTDHFELLGFISYLSERKRTVA